MKRNLCGLFLVVMVGLTGAAAAQIFEIPLTPGQQTGVVESDAHGRCLARLIYIPIGPFGESYEFEIICAHDVEGATMAHIHQGAAGTDGPVVFTFASPTSPLRGVFALSPTDRADLLDGNLYVNVHSSAYPAGEVRGQIGPRADAAVAFALEAEQHTGSVESNNTGHCMAVVNPLQTTFTIACAHTVGGAYGTHIHQAPAGQDGPIVFSLLDATTAASQVGPGRARPDAGRGAPVVFSFAAASTIFDQAVPGDDRFDDAYRYGDFLDALWWEYLYVNVHSPAYPSGELRGQIPRPGLVQYFPQFGNGGGATLEDGFTSSVVLTNPSATKVAEGTMYFFDPEGKALSVGLVEGDGTDAAGFRFQIGPVSEVEFAIEPLGSLTFTTDGLGELIIGSAEVISSEPVGGIIRFRHPQIGIAGFGSAPPLRGAITPARRNAEINTAIAIRNNETFPITVTLEMRGEDGSILGENALVQREIPPDGRIAQYIDELFEGLDTFGMVGTVVISTAEGSFSAIALEMGYEAGLFTSLPMTPRDVP